MFGSTTLLALLVRLFLEMTDDDWEPILNNNLEQPPAAWYQMGKAVSSTSVQSSPTSRRPK